MAEIVITLRYGEGGNPVVQRETAADFAARMAEGWKDSPQIWATFSEDSDPKLVGVRFSSVQDWQISVCPPNDVAMRARHQQSLIGEIASEQKGWLVILTDVHGRVSEKPYDLAFDSDALAVFRDISYHCWGEARASVLQAQLATTTFARDAARASLVEFQQGTGRRR
jgi:hypothetical protein